MEDLIRRCFLAMEMTPQGLRSGKTSLDWPFELNRKWKLCARCHRVIISRTRNLTYVWRISHCFKFIDHTNWSLLQCVQYLVISLLIMYFTLISLANVLFAGMTSLKTVKRHRAVETRWVQPLCTNYFLYTFQRLNSGNKKTDRWKTCEKIFSSCRPPYGQTWCGLWCALQAGKSWVSMMLYLVNIWFFQAKLFGVTEGH